MNPSGADMKIHPLGLILSLLALGAPATGAAQRPTQAPATPAARGDDSVRIGCSGGFTGDGSGNTLTRSGALSAYVRPLREPPTYTPLRGDSRAAAAVFAALERLRFRTLRFKEIGNMTCVLELIDSDGRHEVNWIMRRPPAELEPALAALRRAFRDDRRGWP